MKRKKVWWIILIILVLGVIAGVTAVIIINNQQNKCDPNDTSISWPMEPCMSFDKPIIYLYPEQETEISVTLGHPESLTVSYPSYGDGWRVLAEPSGNLTDLATGRSLYALYWEGKNYPAKMHNTGFVVRGEDVAEFLEEKLAILGLSEREAEEFIVYWLPKMKHNAYNYIHFAKSDDINKYMPLQITPAPDTVIRVAMEFKPLESNLKIPEQSLSTPERKGFTVVEWGGTEISD